MGADVHELFMLAPALIAVQRTERLVLEYVNEAGSRIFGSGVIGQPLRAVVSDVRLVRLVENAFASGKRFVDSELPLARDWDGSEKPYERYFHLVLEPMRTKNDDIEGVLSLGFDVTDLVLARRRIEETARELEVKSRAKDEFLANVSHELRTPLSSIMGWSALLREHATDPAIVLRAAEVIYRNAKAQAKLVDDILDASRIVTGKLRLDKKPVSVPSVVRDALEVIRPPAAAKGITMLEEHEGDVFVVGDEERLRQILLNLLSNAIKFTDRGGDVTARTRCNAGWVTIEVADTGRGMSADFLPHAFERFRQADCSTTRTHGGLGLGLAIVRHLVELHGGTVAVASDGEGLGSTFTVTLPVIAGCPVFVPAMDEAPDIQRGRAPVSDSMQSASLDGVRVLVVDDEADARDVVATALEAWGAVVLTADTARSALEMAVQEAFDVVVSDIGMPHEDGYTLITRLRAAERSGRRVPAVALTAYARTSDAERAIATGFDFHVTKPIDADALRGIVARAAAVTVRP